MKAYIHDDHDGRCAGAILLDNVHGLRPEDITEMNYSNRIPYEEIEKDEQIYIADYSMNEDALQVLKHIYDNITQNIVWIDHHQTSLDALKENKWVEKSNIKMVIKNGICGAGLTYLYFHDIYSTPLTFKDNKKVPKFLRLIDDFDCWKNQMLPESSYLKVAIEAYPYGANTEVWKKLLDEAMSGTDKYLNTLLEEGKIIYKHLMNTYKEIREDIGYESEIDGHPCFVVNNSGNSWVFGELMSKYDYVILFSYNGSGYEYSLYSERKKDCNVIAKKFKGGGHPGASGFSSEKLLFTKLGQTK